MHNYERLDNPLVRILKFFTTKKQSGKIRVVETEKDLSQRDYLVHWPPLVTVLCGHTSKIMT